MLETRLSLLFRNELSKARTGHTTIIKNIKINGEALEYGYACFELVVHGVCVLL